MGRIKLYFFLLVVVICSAFGQWIIDGGGDHSGANWTLSDGDSIAGVHTGIDTFRVPSGNTIFIKHYNGADYGAVEIRCTAAIIEGAINATGAGYRGGSGGVSTSEISPRQRRGGRAGMPGEGPCGGCPGDTGSYGGIAVTVTGEAWGGGGGAGGGRGGGYGGASCPGGNGGNGNCVDVWPYFASGGAGGTGGAGAGACPYGTSWTSGTEDNSDVERGSGGGGAGGGGNSGYYLFYGTAGGFGGAGGGVVAIFADTIFLSGSILANGTAGGAGGNGGNGDLWQGDAAGGGGGGAGGGSGGGILLRAPAIELTSSASISARGGNGGRGGDIGSAGPPGSCGRGGNGGSGGGGGRIKIFYREDRYLNNASIAYNGGSGGARGEDPDGNGTPGNIGCFGIQGTYLQRRIGSIVVTTDLPTEIADSVFIDGEIRPAPHQIFIPLGDSILIAPANPANPYYISRTRYYSSFEGWDCGGDSALWVITIDNDTTFTAQYDIQREFHTLIKKNPLANVAGTLFVDSEAFVGAESDSQWRWWAEGSIHSIGVSEMDSVGEFRKWRFLNWSDGGAVLHNTSPIVSPTDFVANYIARFPVNIFKEPEADTFGFISCDIDTFWGANSVYQRVWWDSASIHILAASSIDTIDGFNRYLLTHFSDGYDSSHFTEPLRAPTDFVAYYDRQHLCHVAKSPSSNIFGHLVIDSDTLRDAESAGVSRWWNHGSTHYIEASEPDYADSLSRYVWDSWSDGLPIGHTTASVDTPCTITANYGLEFLTTFAKEPSYAICGWLAIDGDTIWGVESVYLRRWLREGSLHDIAVSAHDFCGDSVFRFDSWSIAGLILPEFTAEISCDTTFTAFYSGSLPHLEIAVSPSEWDLDTILGGEVRAMADGEEIRVVNLSDVPVDLGLALIDSAGWIPGHYPSGTRFSLRGRFDDSRPIDFSPLEDAILRPPHEIAREDRFGSGGFGLTFSPPDTALLWLQLSAPTPRDSSAYGTKTLKINVLAVPQMD